MISFAAIATYIHSLEIDRGTDPICALNEKRSYVAVTGEGYILGDNQEKEYKQEENKREEQKNRPTVKSAYFIFQVRLVIPYFY